MESAGAYPTDNPHIVNLIAFAKDVGDATGGKLQITVHPGASLFKAPGDQARGGDRTGAGRRGADLAARERGSDVRHRRDPVPGDELSGRPRSCGRRRSPPIEKKLASQGMMLLFAVPWGPQGIYAKKDINTHRRHEGPEVARL